MTHVGQAGIEIFLQTLHESRENDSVLVDKNLSLSFGFHEIRSIVDPIESCFDQRPFTLGTLGLEIGHLVKEAALMLTIGENRSDCRPDPDSTQRRLPADPLATHFEVGPVNDEISKLLGDGPVQPPDQLLLDALVLILIPAVC